MLGATAGAACRAGAPVCSAREQRHKHLHEDRDDLTLQQRLAEGAFDETCAVDIELQPGQMSLHDVHMIHGAAANRSAQRRTGVALRYLPATSHFDRR